MSVLHINNITNKEGTGGPTIAGITTVDSTGFMRVPVGDTRTRLVNDYENIVTDGLVLHLDAGRVESYGGDGTTWRDLSGNGNNGTLQSGVGFTVDDGGSLIFDGVNDYVSVIPINRLTTTTLDIWFNTSSVSTNTVIRQYLYTQQRNPPTLASFTYQERQGIHIAGNLLQFQYLDTTNNDGSIVSISTISANTWYNLVVTLDGTTPKMYLNGTQLSVTGNLSTPKSITVNQAFVGRRGDANGEDRFGGTIASVRDYNRALTASEIQQNFNALVGRYT